MTTKHNTAKVESIEPKQAENPYRVLSLGATEVTANHAIQEATNEGYRRLVSVYTVSTPASSSVAFAVMEK